MIIKYMSMLEKVNTDKSYRIRQRTKLYIRALSYLGKLHVRAIWKIDYLVTSRLRMDRRNIQ